MDFTSADSFNHPAGLADLTGKQRAFVLHRLAHPTATATASAIAAGYAADSANVRAAKLMADPKISRILDRETRRAAARAAISLESHLNTLARLRQQAAKANQFGPAVTAEVSRGKAAGLYEDKVRFMNDTLKGLSNDDLQRLARELGDITA